MTVRTANSPAALKAYVAVVMHVDGTLVVTDLLQEAALQLTARNPLQSFRIPLWLASGKANLKVQLADRVDPGI